MVSARSGDAADSRLLVDKLERIKSSLATTEQVVFSVHVGFHETVQLLRELVAMIRCECSRVGTVLVEDALAEVLNMLHFNGLALQGQRPVSLGGILGQRERTAVHHVQFLAQIVAVYRVGRAATAAMCDLILLFGHPSRLYRLKLLF